jgi:hypothetical protein
VASSDNIIVNRLRVVVVRAGEAGVVPTHTRGSRECPVAMPEVNGFLQAIEALLQRRHALN